jgi:deazaflavin-dependent oxidoreductase (nitroreductase family)
MRGQRLANVLVRGLLRTPGLCRIVGNQLVTLYVVGRKSGRRYPVPVAYLRQGDDLLIGTSFAWAHNLRTGDHVAVRLKGRRRRADVRALTQEADVVSAYAHMARANPAFARFNKVRVGADGEPDNHDLHLAWRAGARVIRLTPQR